MDIIGCSKCSDTVTHYHHDKAVRDRLMMQKGWVKNKKKWICPRH